MQAAVTWSQPVQVRASGEVDVATLVFALFYLVLLGSLVAAFVALPFLLAYEAFQLVRRSVRRFKSGPPGDPAMLTTDRARRLAAEALSDGYAQGRLDGGDFDRRTTAALQARTAGELATVLADLPWRPLGGLSRVLPSYRVVVVGLAVAMFAGTTGRIAGAFVVLAAVFLGDRAGVVSLAVLAAAIILG